MDCKQIWYNLPNMIKIKLNIPLRFNFNRLPIEINNFLREQELNNSTCYLQYFTSNYKTNWFFLLRDLKKVCELVSCQPLPQFNFDVISSNWSTIVDAQSFKSYLESQSGETINIVTDFSLVGNRLQCNVSNIIDMYIGSLNITEVKNITILGLQGLYLNNNQLTTFNPTLPLPTSLQQLLLNNNQLNIFNPSLSLPTFLQSLVLNNNQLTTFNPTLSLPISLQGLYLNNNQLTTFNATLLLPTSLQFLQISFNQLTTFNPILPLPNTLRGLVLNNNQLNIFNPSLSLPNSLESLKISFNQLTTFNPTLSLPTSLRNLDLNNNKITTLGYTQSEPWANLQMPFIALCQILTAGNINSGNNTNLDIILNTKNANIIT